MPDRGTGSPQDSHVATCPRCAGRHVTGAGSGPDAYEYRLTVPSGEGEQTTPTRLTATSPAPTPSPKNPSMVCSLSPDGPARAFRWRGGSWYAACECGWRTRTHFDEQRARDDAAQHVRTHTPPERVEAARPVPEASRGWDDREHPELARDGGHDQDVAPKGSADGTGAETRHATHDGGGNPGSAPDAAFEQLRLVA